MRAAFYRQAEPPLLFTRAPLLPLSLTRMHSCCLFLKIRACELTNSLPSSKGETAGRRARWICAAGAVGVLIGAVIGAIIGWAVALSDTRVGWALLLATSSRAAPAAIGTQPDGRVRPLRCTQPAGRQRVRAARGPNSHADPNYLLPFSSPPRSLSLGSHTSPTGSTMSPQTVALLMPSPLWNCGTTRSAGYCLWVWQ